MGRGVHYYLIGDAASRRGLSRAGYFITLNGPLNWHPLSIILTRVGRIRRIRIKKKQKAEVVCTCQQKITYS